MVEENDLRPEAATAAIDPRRAASLAAAVILAALGPAAVVTLLAHAIRWLPFAFVIALGHALLGLPIFAALDRKGWVNAATAVAVGLAIGAIPGVIMSLPLNSTMNASTNGVPTVVNGARTMAGWLDYAQMLGLLCGCGALGGSVFWATLKLCGWWRVDHDATVARRPSSSRRIVPVASVGLAVMLAAGVFAIPAITRDRTCHNMFRNGGTSIVPQVRMDLQIEMADWPRLTELFERFATAHDLSFRNSSQDQPQAFRVLALDLCTEAGANININDQRWASKGFAPLVRGRGTTIYIYAVRENSGWQKLAHNLAADLQSEWPDKVRFLGGTSHVIPMPKELEQP
jgi:hypothetical protein